MATPTPPTPTSVTDRTLDVFEVIEQEYAHLHPDPGAASGASNWHFEPDQVRDASSMARIFFEALGNRDNKWERSPAHSVALYMYRYMYVGAKDLAKSTKELVESSKALHAPPATEAKREAHKVKEEAFKDLLVKRLNGLVNGPLLAGTAFDALYDEAGVSRADSSSAERQVRANRLLLQSAFSPSIKRLRDVRLDAVYAKIRGQGHTAICLSGGGIRSATFALGVLTGLARKGLLGKFDYLSTVSGGGYIGSWLSAWMNHEDAKSVQDQLGSMTGEKLRPDPEPVRHLRAYSSYLSPELGLLSADTWTLVATMLRNLLLNWVVVVPLLLSVLLLPRLAVSALRYGMDRDRLWFLGLWSVASEDVVWFLYGVGFLAGMAAIKHVHRNRPEERDEPPPFGERTQEAFINRCLLPLVLAAVALTLGWWVHEHASRTDDWFVPTETLGWFAGAGLVMHFLGWWWGVRRLSRKGLEVAVIMLTGAAGGLVSAQLEHLVHLLARNQILADLIAPEQILAPRLYVTLAVPAFLTMILIASQLTIGLTSRRGSDDEREWGARFNAWLFIVIVVWVALNFVALIMPPIIENAVRSADGGIGAGSVSGVIAMASGIITLLLGRSAATPAMASPPGVNTGAIDVAKRIALAVAAPVFAVSLVSLLSAANGQLVVPGVCRVGWCGERYNNPPPEAIQSREKHPADFAPPVAVALTSVLLLVLGWGLGRRIDTNQFSLHAMYRNRLIRAYLRASRPRDKRAADPFTGFDRGDDLPIGALWPATATDAERKRDRDELMKPLHVVNMTLNLVSGRSLAWQQRKAASLTATALHAGSAFVGYRRTSVPRDASALDAKATKLYGGPNGITLGTAVTISGAAASPASGYNSSPAVTFLMALFNARLGWWLGNPGASGDKTFDRTSPVIGVGPLLKEMFGLTTATNDYVFLSDGGHFENLGLYEMVLRRCRFILVSDGGCDPTGSFEDLGNALRKIRIDQGVSIEFPDGLRIVSRDSKKDGTYWAVGKICYSQVDRPEGDQAPDDAYDGVLLYVKPAIYDNEPADVDNYARMSPTFPHETTANQFFTESQFESYRALGSHIVDKMCEQLDNEKGDERKPVFERGGNPSPQFPLAWLRAQRKP